MKRRVGRTRKIRERERNGRAQRSSEQQQMRDNLSAALRQRQWLKDWQIPESQWLDPRWNDPLGVLLLTRRLEQAHYDHGIRYRDTALAYRLTQGLPSGFPKLLGVKGVSHYEVDDHVAQAIKQRYLAYRHKILAKAGERALACVHLVCASERMIDLVDEHLDQLRRGLAALAKERTDKFVRAVLEVAGISAYWMTDSERRTVVSPPSQRLAVGGILPTT